MMCMPGSASTSSGIVGPHMLSRAVVVTTIGSLSALAALARPRDFWDPIKYLRLTKIREDMFVSIGGETRQYVEIFQNELWGSTGYVDHVSWLQRYMLHAELRLTRYARVFVQLKSGLEVGRLGGPRPVDEDRLDANQTFVDVDAVPGRTLDDLSHLTLRIGRQEMSYGSGRL